MKPSISALRGITQKAYAAYASSLNGFIGRGFLHTDETPPAWEVLDQSHRDGYQNAAYAAITFVNNVLMPLSGQCYNAYVMQLGVDFAVDWVELNQAALEAWYQFGLAARRAYEEVA